MLITAKELREEITLKGGESAVDEGRIERARDEVVGLFESETGLLWERRADYVETFQPRVPGTTSLFLSLTPVESVSAVETRVRGASEWTTEDLADFVLTGDRELVHLFGSWPAFVRVTYTGGYTAAPTGSQRKTPGHIRRALITQARFLVDRLAGDKLLTRQRAVEKVSTLYERADLHPLFTCVVEQHRSLV